MAGQNPARGSARETLDVVGVGELVDQIDRQEDRR
jgi:hypothetical protein